MESKYKRIAKHINKHGTTEVKVRIIIEYCVSPSLNPYFVFHDCLVPINILRNKSTFMKLLHNTLLSTDDLEVNPTAVSVTVTQVGSQDEHTYVPWISECGGGLEIWERTLKQY